MKLRNISHLSGPTQPGIRDKRTLQNAISATASLILNIHTRKKQRRFCSKMVYPSEVAIRPTRAILIRIKSMEWVGDSDVA